MRRRPRLAPKLLLPVVAAVATACEVTASVDVAVDTDGSGSVTVSVVLDEEAIGRLPDLTGDGDVDLDDLAALVRTDDLASAGWQIVGPAPLPAGAGRLEASKPFGTLDEAQAVLVEVAGEDGPLRDFRLERTSGFASSRFAFSGVADLRKGLESFSDLGVAEALEGEALGESVADIEERLDRPLSQAFRLMFDVDLPGSLEANDGRSGDTARWALSLDEDPVVLEATSTVRRPAVLVLTGVAVASGVALLAVLVLVILRRPGKIARRTSIAV